MRWHIRRRYRRLIRSEAADIVIALGTGIIANMIADAIGRRRRSANR
jgi:hypothetical protein